jgi:hypothetical protein
MVAGGNTMRRWIEIVTVVLFVGFLGACSQTVSSPDDAATCGELVDLALTVVVDVRDSASDLTSEDFSGPVGGDTETLALMLVEGFGPITVRSSELGCDSDKWNGEYQERVLQLVPMTRGGLVVISIAGSEFPKPF